MLRKFERKTKRLVSKSGIKKMAKEASDIAKGATDVVDDIKDFSADVSTTAINRVGRFVREFNDAIPALKSLGFSVTRFTVEVGMMPEIGATLAGSVRALNPGKIRELLQKRSGNKPLAALLHALLISANFKDQLKAMGIRAIELNIALGLPTSVTVDLLA
jgi:hypothetical protein